VIGKIKEPRRLSEGNVKPTSDMHFNENLIYIQCHLVNLRLARKNIADDSKRRW
jgi:hypothetical protein